ncbi:hypothetical protein C0995_013280 [Termitomyces sp. Mi166|nr:hypothetical protein C0995_013280 [Termitomyces sp. Mi166\
MDKALIWSGSEVNMVVMGEQRSSNFIRGVPFGILEPGANVVKTLCLVNAGAPGDRVIDISVQSRPLDSIVNPAEPELDDMTETTRLLTVPTVYPFKVVQSVSYKRGLETWSGLADLDTFDGDKWNSTRTSEALGLVLPDVRSTRELDSSNVLWTKLQFQHPKDGSFGSESSTTISLPGLRTPDEGLVALLSIPSSAALHVPMPLTLAIRNYHPSRSANIVVHLELEPSDGFIVAGLRSGRLPILMPGDEEKFTWKLIPIECGHVKIPQIKIIDKRPLFTGGTEPTAEMVTKGEMVEIVNVRLASSSAQTTGGQSDLGLGGGLGTVLVLTKQDYGGIVEA